MFSVKTWMFRPRKMVLIGIFCKYLIRSSSIFSALFILFHNKTRRFWKIQGLEYGERRLWFWIRNSCFHYRRSCKTWCSSGTRGRARTRTRSSTPWSGLSVMSCCLYLWRLLAESCFMTRQYKPPIFSSICFRTISACLASHVDLTRYAVVFLGETTALTPPPPPPPNISSW